MAEWQPIETAPRDGSRIRLGHEKEPGFGTKDPHRMGAASGTWNGKVWDLSSFFIITGGRYGMITNDPTHWMHLPPLPTNQEQTNAK